jgi:homospermidine synthase
VNTIQGIQESSSSKYSQLYYHYKEIQFLKNHINSSNFNTLLQKYLTSYNDNSIQTHTPTLIQLKNEFDLIKVALNNQQQQATYREI